MSAPGGQAPAPAFFAVPGDLRSRTGGYEYARQLLAAMPATGPELSLVQLPSGFPQPTPADLRATEQALAALPDAAVVLVDGLAYGTFPAGLIARLPQTLIPLVHHPLALETGPTAAEQERLAAAEREALERAPAVLVTSVPTAAVLATDYAVPTERITVAVPGTHAAQRAGGSGDSVLSLLAVGTLTPRKGYRVLIDALAQLPELSWRLRIVGDTDRSVAEFDALTAAAARAGLADRIEFAGLLEPAALEAAFQASDLFVMPSLYEGFGMALTEAMARGLPIVSTTGGAAGHTVPDGAGRKVPPADVDALVAALRTMLTDPTARRAAAAASWTAGQNLARWTDTAAIVAGVLRALNKGRTP